MTTKEFDAIYETVPDAQKEKLLRFRAEHPYHELNIDGKKWRYLSSGEGEDNLIFLLGGFLTGDMWFHPISALEASYRILSPDAYTRMGFSGMHEVCDAIVRMMDHEGMDKATFIGMSAGGGIAQVFLQTNPDRVSNMVLSHCGMLRQDLNLSKRADRLRRVASILPVGVIRWIVKRQTTGVIPENSQWAAFEAAYFREIGSQVTKAMFVNFLSDAAATRRDFVAKPEVIQAWPGTVIVLTSEDDAFSFNSLEEIQNYYPRVQSHVFPEGGHHTLFLFPEQFTEALMRILSASDTAQPSQLSS